MMKTRWQMASFQFTELHNTVHVLSVGRMVAFFLSHNNNGDAHSTSLLSAHTHSGPLLGHSDRHSSSN